MNLSLLQQERNEWVAHNFPTDRDRGPTWSILGAVEEVGELAHAHLKMEQGIRGTTEEHVEAMADAVADCVIYLAGVCTHLGLDYGEIVTDTWREVKKRDWILYPDTGRAPDVAADSGG